MALLIAPLPQSSSFLSPLTQPSSSLVPSHPFRSPKYVIAAPNRCCVPRVTAGASVNWSSKGNSDFSIYVHGVSKKEMFSWDKLESDLNYWTRPLRPVQV